MQIFVGIPLILYHVIHASAHPRIPLSELCRPHQSVHSRPLILPDAALCLSTSRGSSVGNLTGLFTWPPFALFSLVELSSETIDSILQKAFKGSTVYSWEFYLVTGSYASAPQKTRGAPIGSIPGTRAPIDKTFKSAFIGHNEMDAAEWLKKKPAGVDLDSFFFAVLDKEAEKTGSVVLCRVGNGPPGALPPVHDYGDDAVTCLLRKAEASSLFLAGMEAYEWENQLQGRGGEYYPDV